MVLPSRMIHVSSYAVCPHLVKVNPNKRFSKVPVCICNISARPLCVRPRSLIYHLQEVEVVRSLDPVETGLGNRSCNWNKTLSDLGVNVSSDVFSPER